MSKKRSIFEEITDDAQDLAEKPKPIGGMIDQGNQGARGGIRIWLIVLFALVMIMIMVGGLTRLTDSGLSITEWRVIGGAIPPMNTADWASEFAKYQAIPEFKVQNAWMELSDFKAIYWWEWGHRQLGRVIGLVWAFGFFGFLVARKIPAGWTGRLIWIGALGGLQGAVGWWMVSSGLGAGMLDVASYRLATHLGLGFIILGFIAWYIFLLGRSERDLMQARRAREGKLYGLSTGLLHFAFLQILIGALVAGIDAGRSFTDWPLMGGQFVPPDAMIIIPAWRNFFENPGLVQFVHRMVGYALLVFAIVVWLRGRKSAHHRTASAFHFAFGALLLQVVLGIITVMTGAPWQVAILHQILAAITWVLILRARFLAQYPVASSIREGK